MKLALVHDLGEIEAGDTFLYADKRSQAHVNERIGVEKLTMMTGNPVPELLTLWDEQETGDSAESKLLKVVDTIRNGGHINSVNRLLWLPGCLVSCSDDRTVMLWGVEH